MSRTNVRLQDSIALFRWLILAAVVLAVSSNMCVVTMVIRDEITQDLQKVFEKVNVDQMGKP